MENLTIASTVKRTVKCDDVIVSGHYVIDGLHAVLETITLPQPNVYTKEGIKKLTKCITEITSYDGVETDDLL